MAEYRRNRVPGGSFFFSLNLLDRGSDLLVAHVDVLREAVRRTRLRSPFRIDAWVVFSDHMRCLWTPAFERVKELVSKRKPGAARPPCVVRDAPSALLTMTCVVDSIEKPPDPRPAPGQALRKPQHGCLEGRTVPTQPSFNSLTRSEAGGRLLPPVDADFPGRWRAIKIAFAKSVPEGEPRSPS